MLIASFNRKQWEVFAEVDIMSTFCLLIWKYDRSTTLHRRKVNVTSTCMHMSIYVLQLFWRLGDYGLKSCDQHNLEAMPLVLTTSLSFYNLIPFWFGGISRWFDRATSPRSWRKPWCWTKGIKTWNFTKIVFETVPIPCIELPLVNDACFIPESWSCGAALLVLELRLTLNFLVLTQVWW